jgi:hypothetical protein
MPKRTFVRVDIPDVLPQKYSLKADLNNYQMAWYPSERSQKPATKTIEPRKRRRRNNSWVPTIKRRVVGIREQRARRRLHRPLPIRVRAQKSDEEPPPPTTPMALLGLPNSSAEHTAWERSMRDAIVPLQFDATELVTNTGALKGSWTQGIDPNSCYTGEVDDVFQVGSVYQVSSSDGPLIARRDEHVPYVDKPVQTDSSSLPNVDGEEQTAKAVLTYSTIRAVESVPVPIRPYPRTDPVPILQLPLRTSDEPTFIRTFQEPIPPWAHMKSPGRQTAKDTTASAALPSPAIDQATPMETPLPTQDKIKRYGTPKNLTEIELIGSALAKGLNIAPFPGFFDAPAGHPGVFNLHEQLNVYGYTPRQPTPTPIDYGVALASRLNFAPPESHAEVRGPKEDSKEDPKDKPEKQTQVNTGYEKP